MSVECREIDGYRQKNEQQQQHHIYTHIYTAKKRKQVIRISLVRLVAVFLFSLVHVSYGGMCVCVVFLKPMKRKNTLTNDENQGKNEKRTNINTHTHTNYVRFLFLLHANEMRY